MMLKTCATALLLASATRATPNASARRRLQADACSADLNDDNAIDVADLLQLLASFGTSTDGDATGDGVTDVADLLLLLANFGADLGSSCDDTSSGRTCDASSLAGMTAQASSGRDINVVSAVPAVGDLPFTDRGYTFTSMGSFEGTGMYYVQPANNDKDTPSNSVMWTLNVGVPVTVYLDFWGGDVHTDSTGVADWLQTPTSQWVRQTDMTGTAFTPGYGPGPVFAQTFPAGTIEIMGNGGNGHGTFYLFVEPNCASLADGDCPCGGAPSGNPGVIYDGTGYDQFPAINPSSRMFEIRTEFKTVQAEGMILAVGQHGNWDVDHIVIEIVDGFIWFDFAPGGNNGETDNANVNMNSQVRVNDNNWHTFLGERYACYIENPSYSPSSFNAEWAASGRSGLTCSRNGAQDGRLTIDGVQVSEDHGTGGASGVDTTMPVFIGGHPDIVNGNWAAGDLSWGLGTGDVTLNTLGSSAGSVSSSSCGIACGHDAIANYAGCLTDLSFQITTDRQGNDVADSYCGTWLDAAVGDGTLNQGTSFCGTFTMDGTGGRCLGDGVCTISNVALGKNIIVDSEFNSPGSCGSESVCQDGRANCCSRDRAVDGITDAIHGRWLTPPDNPVHWAVIDLNERYTITSTSLIAGHCGGTNGVDACPAGAISHGLCAYKFEVWGGDTSLSHADLGNGDDNDGWITIAENSASGGDHLLADSLDANAPIESQFVRLTIDQSGCSVSNHARVFEIEVYGCMGGGSGGWTQAASNVCFGAGGSAAGAALQGGINRGDDAPAAFSIPMDATALKIVKTGGVGVSCNYQGRVNRRGADNAYSNWGCDFEEGSSLGTFITPAACGNDCGRGDVVAPPATRIHHDNLWWAPYDRIDIDARNWAGADELVFTMDDSLDHVQEMFPAGDYLIWYGEDLADRSEGDNAGETCVDVYYAALDISTECDPPVAVCPAMEAAQSSDSQICADGGAAYCEVFERTRGRTCTEYCAESNLACLDGWDEVGGGTVENCQRWMEGHTHGTLHDFGIGGCLNPFGGQICRCGAASACGVYQDFDFNWVDISDTGTRITSWDDGSNSDDGWKHIDVPFDFPWYGTVQNTITVGTNGVITFGTGHLPNGGSEPVPSGADGSQVRGRAQEDGQGGLVDGLIAVFWADINPGAASQSSDGVFYQIFDGAGTPHAAGSSWAQGPSWQQLIVQWNNVQYWVNAGVVGGAANGVTNSFECILFGDGAILMQYLDMDPTHLSWSTESIGFEDSTGMYGTQISWGTIPAPETAYWIPACAHTLPQEGDGHCRVPPAITPMQDLPDSFGCALMGCSGSGSSGATGCARLCSAAGTCNTEGYGSHAADCSLVGYWPLDGNANDAGPQGNSLSANWDNPDHLNNVVYTAGFRGLAYYGSADQSLQIIDPGDSPFDLTQITMAAWVMPTAHTIAPGSSGYQAEAIIFNKESTYEIALSTGGYGGPGTFIGAFSRCWRWWGNGAVAGVGVWTHVIGGVDGTNEVHYVNGVPDGTASCAGDLTLNDYPFKIGARARGTGHATQSDQDASAVDENGSRFFGEIDEAMVFDFGVDAAQAAAIYNLF